MFGATRRGMWRLAAAGLAGALGSGLLIAVSQSGASAKITPPEVLYVGSYKGIATPPAQTFSTIQAAVNAAVKGDWILVAPGDYHENDDASITAASPGVTGTGWYGGVLITTPDIHLRGMNRNSVIVDGTLSNTDNQGVPCSPAQDDQNLLPVPNNGNPENLGRNGIVAWANGVTIDNLTVCNFLAGAGSSGNEIWWNGGANTGLIGVKGYEGSYLSATSTYFQADAGQAVNKCSVCGLYGIFASNAKGPATLDNTYANNFSDSGMYVGACHRACDVTISNARMEDNALGYSGTNSGGQVVIENSIFDNNKDGLDTNTALTGDPPPPQNGECLFNRPTATSVQIPGTLVNSCWVFENNTVEDNNNANVPVSDTAGLGPTGTGMTISGGRNDVVQDNKFLDNQAWGILFAPYPDPSLTSDGRTCTGTGGVNISALAAALDITNVNCLYDPKDDALLDNGFSGNGTLGNPSNADFGNLLGHGPDLTNCFSGNQEFDPTFTTATGPATSADAIDGLPSLTPSSCGVNGVQVKTPKSTALLGPDTDGTLLGQVECDSGVLTTGCTGTYPQATGVTMQPLPGASSLTDPESSALLSMPNPCDGTLANLWCPGGSPA